MTFFLKVIFWPIKESVKFCLFLFLLFQFTSLSTYVEPRAMAIGLSHVAKNGWARVHDTAVSAAALVRTASATESGKATHDKTIVPDKDSR